MNNELQQNLKEKYIRLFKVNDFYNPMRKLSSGSEYNSLKSQQNTSATQEYNTQQVKVQSQFTKDTQNFYDIQDANTCPTSKQTLQSISHRRRTNSLASQFQSNNLKNTSILKNKYGFYLDSQGFQQYQPQSQRIYPSGTNLSSQEQSQKMLNQTNPNQLNHNNINSGYINPGQTNNGQIKKDQRNLQINKSSQKKPIYKRERVMSFSKLYDEQNQINIFKDDLNKRYNISKEEDQNVNKQQLYKGKQNTQKINNFMNTDKQIFIRQSKTQGHPVEGILVSQRSRDQPQNSQSLERKEFHLVRNLINCSSSVNQNNHSSSDIDNNQSIHGINSSRRILLKKVTSISHQISKQDLDSQDNNEQQHYMKNTQSYQVKTFSPRNKRHLLLYGKEMEPQQAKSCSRRSESPTSQNKHQINSLCQNIKQIRNKSKASSVYSQHVSKEEKIHFKEILVKLLNYEKDMTDDQNQINQINALIQDKMKSKSNLEAIVYEEDEVLRSKIRTMIESKHMKMSKVVENLNAFQESYRHLQYGTLTEDKFINMIEEMAAKQKDNEKGKQLLKNIVKKIQFNNLISSVNKCKLSKQESMITDMSQSHVLLNESFFQNSPMHSINSPVNSPFMNRQQRAEFYQAVGIEDTKQYMKNKIYMLQNLYQKKQKSDQQDDKDLIEGMMKCWKFDKKGRMIVQGFQKKKVKKQDIYSNDRLQRKYAYLRNTFREFFSKCDKIGVDPALALQNKYFNSLPFTRPGSFVLFKSLKEGNLEIVNKMFTQNIEYIYERDHLLQNCLHVAIQKRLKILSLWLIHQKIDFDSKDVANKTPVILKLFKLIKLYYAIKYKMYDIAKYLLYKRASPWSENKKYRYDQMTNNSAMIRVIKKAKLIDLCGKMNKSISQRQNWQNQKKTLYVDYFCRIPGELECLNKEERQYIEQEIQKFEEKEKLEQQNILIQIN